MPSYIAYNGPMTTSGSYVPINTGVAGTVKTMLQIAAGTTDPLVVWKWGLDFDGTGTTPIRCELVHTGTVGATLTAHVAAGIQPYTANQSPSAVQLGAALTGYGMGANVTPGGTGTNNTSEGTITTTRYASINSVLPGNGDRNEWSLGREFFVPAGGIIRIRVMASAQVNCMAYMMWDD